MRSGTAGSVLANLGMPRIPSTGDGIFNLSASIGQCIQTVSEEEQRITGKLPKNGNRLVRRWQAYLAMCTARNMIPLIEHQLAVEHHRLESGYGDVERLATLEEELIQIKSTYRRLKRRNDRLRKGRLYLTLSSTMMRELKRRGVHV